MYARWLQSHHCLVLNPVSFTLTYYLLGSWKHLSTCSPGTENLEKDIWRIANPLIESLILSWKQYVPDTCLLNWCCFLSEPEKFREDQRTLDLQDNGDCIAIKIPVNVGLRMWFRGRVFA